MLLYSSNLSVHNPGYIFLSLDCNFPDSENVLWSLVALCCELRSSLSHQFVMSFLHLKHIVVKMLVYTSLVVLFMLELLSPFPVIVLGAFVTLLHAATIYGGATIHAYTHMRPETLLCQHQQFIFLNGDL